MARRDIEQGEGRREEDRGVEKTASLHGGTGEGSGARLVHQGDIAPMHRAARVILRDAARLAGHRGGAQQGAAAKYRPGHRITIDAEAETLAMCREAVTGGRSESC